VRVTGRWLVTSAHLGGARWLLCRLACQTPEQSLPRWDRVPWVPPLACQQCAASGYEHCRTSREWHPGGRTVERPAVARFLRNLERRRSTEAFLQRRSPRSLYPASDSLRVSEKLAYGFAGSNQRNSQGDQVRPTDRFSSCSQVSPKPGTTQEHGSIPATTVATQLVPGVRLAASFGETRLRLCDAPAGRATVQRLMSCAEYGQAAVGAWFSTRFLARLVSIEPAR